MVSIILLLAGLTCVCLSEGQFKNQNALSTPLKWLSDEDKNWYFEEQIDGQTWIEKANFTNQANYTKKFNDTDIWGMVIILEINDNQNDWIRLTEGIACVFDKLNLECKSIITHGYWAKKHFDINQIQDDLAKPLKWISDRWTDWFFEQQRNNEFDWILYDWSEKMWRKSYYTQISIYNDLNDGLLVLLKKKQSDKSYLLSEGHAYRCSDGIKCVRNPTTTGYWAKKPGMCKNLPSNCKYINYRHLKNNTFGPNKNEGILCSDEFDDAKLKKFIYTWKRCPWLQDSIIDFSIKLSSDRQIINDSFGIFKLDNALPVLRLPLFVRIFNIMGFDIESPIIKIKNVESLTFYDSVLNFYSKNKSVKDCQDFNNLKSQGFIFQSSKMNNLDLNIFKPKLSHSICSLFFRNSNINELKFVHIASTYFLNNKVSFTDLAEDDQEDLESNIKSFAILNTYNIKIDSRIINKKILARTLYLFFDNVQSLEENVFSSFPELSMIYFEPRNLIKIIRNQGISWIKRINSDIDVNINEKIESFNIINLSILIGLSFERYFAIDWKEPFANDKDFCLFADYPFKQMVFIIETEDLYNFRIKSVYSCTEQWLFRYNTIFESFAFQTKKIKTYNLTACDFQRRLNLCMKGKWNSSKPSVEKSEFLKFELMVALEFMLIIFSSLLASYAIVTNAITIYVIFHKNNIKTTREKHYIYMSLHCVFNSLIGFIQIIDLMSECQYPFGLFCSSIRKVIAVQYIKLIFGEYFNSLFRLLSNFTYLGFSLCRMFKVGKDHGKLIIFMNELSIKKYMLVWTLVSAGLTVCKALQFDINFDMIDYTFPVNFIQNINRYWVLRPDYVAITVINAVYDLINYFVFIIVHFSVDIVLVAKLKKVLKEKEVKMRELKSQGLEKTMKDNKESIRRLVLMVVFSSIFNLATKAPSTILSLNDVRLIIHLPVSDFRLEWFKFGFNLTSFSFKYFCFNQKGCLIFQNFCNCLFQVSICSPLHFLKFFDKNFQIAYEQTFPKKENQLKKAKN